MNCFLENFINPDFLKKSDVMIVLCSPNISQEKYTGTGKNSESLKDSTF